MERKMSKNRSYCFTWNNYSIENIDYVKDYITKNSKYGCFGVEIGTSGTPHLQGYIQFENPRSYKKIINDLKGCHIIISKGNKKQNIDYCSKDNSFWEFGNKDTQGERTDLKELVKDVLNGGVSVNNILRDDPLMYHQYGRTLDKVEDLKISELRRNHFTRGVWWFGKTGTGKSYRAKQYCIDNKLSYIELPKDYYKNGWFDCYKGEDVIIINDFRGRIPYEDLLNICDENQFSFNRRGRCPFPCISKFVFITSSLNPYEVYNQQLHKNDSLCQLERRFDILRILDKNSEPIEYVHDKMDDEKFELIFNLGTEQKRVG
uniref:ATP-dependent helicase Rep n=1 Tax=Diporeia sp. associated circular virus TaxID=1299317 RepID=M1T816_9VIRU|nr:replication-associated protein [Diporeia sp. associated circular virus]